MTGAIALLIALTTTLAAVVVLYALCVSRAFALPRVADRAMSVFPLATPVLAWRAGARALPIALVVCAFLYVVLQAWASSR